MTKDGRMLLQIDVDAAEKYPVQTDVVLIRAQRRVHWDEQDFVAQCRESFGQPIVVQTRAAKPISRPGREIDNAWRPLFAGLRCRFRRLDDSSGLGHHLRGPRHFTAGTIRLPPGQRSLTILPPVGRRSE